MGWYTSGPGGARYKYGDVAGAFCELDMGTLWGIPSLKTEAETYTLHELRTTHLSHLDWSPLRFDMQGDLVPDGIVANQEWIDELLDDIVRFMQAHKEAVQQAIATAQGYEVSTRTWCIGLELCWHVPGEMTHALDNWILEQSKACTHLALGQGKVMAGVYHPAESLQDVFQAYQAEPTTHFLMSMIGAHATSPEVEFFLEQPDDEWQKMWTP